MIMFIIFFLEIFLRIYNPFGFRQKGDEIILPRNRKMIFTNDHIPLLEKKITHTKNALGFRGPEMPSDLAAYTSIIAVGGSATECFFLSDAYCWTNLLADRLKSSVKNIWINNAGFQGHSTFGHYILINEYIKQLHPDYILLMAGYNEIDREDIKNDESVAKTSRKNTAWGWLKRHSETVSLALNIERHLMADRLSVSDRYADLEGNKKPELFLSSSAIDSVLQLQQPLVESFRHRLNKIADTCISNHINLVLITQPILFGKGIDDKSGVNLETYPAIYNRNGLLIWKLLELYNEATRDVAKQKNLFIIDLAKEMPKSSLYFYDICHFTNQGSEKVSEILAGHLTGFLK